MTIYKQFWDYRINETRKFLTILEYTEAATRGIL